MLTHGITGKGSPMSGEGIPWANLLAVSKNKRELGKPFSAVEFLLTPKKSSKPIRIYIFFWAGNIEEGTIISSRRMEPCNGCRRSFMGYHWFRIRLCQRKEILPLLLSTVHWHGFLISGDPQAFTPACKCTLFPHRKHEFKYLCVWLSLPVPTLISCELLRAELFKKGK